MQQMNYNADPNVQQMPQNLNPQGSQTDFINFYKVKDTNQFHFMKKF